jgi:hypothetical protein
VAAIRFIIRRHRQSCSALFRPAAPCTGGAAASCTCCRDSCQLAELLCVGWHVPYTINAGFQAVVACGASQLTPHPQSCFRAGAIRS